MAAVFPRWFDSVFRLALVLVALSVVGIPILLMVWVRSPANTNQGRPVVQPIQFDHRHHVRDDGIDCLYCHYDASRAPSAGVPGADLCMGCHAQIYPDSPQLEPVRESYFDSKPLVWRRVHDLSDFAYFNHAVHVQRGVGCESCHGRVDQMAAVYKAESLHMGWCLDCHRNPAPHVRPAGEITTMGYAPRSPQEGQRLVRELNISPPTHCSGCHR